MNLKPFKGLTMFDKPAYWIMTVRDYTEKPEDSPKWSEKIKDPKLMKIVVELIRVARIEVDDMPESQQTYLNGIRLALRIIADAEDFKLKTYKE